MFMYSELSESSGLPERLRLRLFDDAGIVVFVIVVPDGPEGLWESIPRGKWAEIDWVLEDREVEVAGWSEVNGVGRFWGVSSARTNG